MHMCSSAQAVCHHQLCLSAPWRRAARATRQKKRASRRSSSGTYIAGTGLKTRWHASARTCDRVVTRWQQAGRDSLIQKSSIRTQLASERISPERVNHHRRLSACRSVGRPDGLSLALPHTPGRGPRAATMEGAALAARERPPTPPCLRPELGVPCTSRGRCDALSAPSAKPLRSRRVDDNVARGGEKNKKEDRRGKRKRRLCR